MPEVKGVNFRSSNLQPDESERVIAEKKKDSGVLRDIQSLDYGDEDVVRKKKATLIRF